MSKKSIIFIIAIICAACIISAFFVTRKIIKKKDMKERYEVMNVNVYSGV